MGWISEGVQSNPGSGTVLADTGPINGGGSFTIKPLLMGANVAVTVELQRRNAANNATIFSHRFFLGSSDATEVASQLYFSGLADQERLRVVTTSAVSLGSCQASFYYE